MRGVAVTGGSRGSRARRGRRWPPSKSMFFPCLDARMARIEPIDPAAAPDDVREALENLPPLNIFRTLAHAETAFRPFLRFGGAVLGRMQLDPIVRELAILTVAHEAEAEYEWIQHVAIAKAVGATDAQIGAIAD